MVISFSKATCLSVLAVKFKTDFTLDRTIPLEELLINGLPILCYICGSVGAVSFSVLPCSSFLCKISANPNLLFISLVL